MHSYNLLSEFDYYLKKKPLAGCRNWLNFTRGQFLEGPEMCFTQKAVEKSQTL